MNRIEQTYRAADGTDGHGRGVWIPALLLGLILLGGVFLSPAPATAQTIPVGELREEQLRIQQLLQGAGFSSFTHRPVHQSIYDAYMSQSGEKGYWWNEKLERNETTLQLPEGFGTARIGLHEPHLLMTTNSRVPYGENNGAAWYGKGINSELMGGFYLASDYFTLQVRPQIVWQQNNDFVVPRFIPRTESGEIRYVAEGIGDQIDRPFRFGPDPFWTIDYGHTSFRLHYGAVEAGYGSEPLWWGGNVRYALLLSNNAPGVRHLFLGTRRPVRIPGVLSFEVRWIGGWPRDSEWFDQPEEYQQKRFMSAFNFSFSFDFLPDLHFGFSRATHSYVDHEGLFFSDIFSVFDPVPLENVLEKRGPLEERKPRNELNSVYARWVWPESRMEIYGEYFRDDHFWDWRDFLMEPNHNSGYAFGFQKLFDAPLARHYRVNLEFTNMTPSFLANVRPQFYYYAHEEIRQGHTNGGHILGAAIGPGSNSQFLSVDALARNGRVGLHLRRLADNNHFHYAYDRSLQRGREYGDYWRHRTDLTVGLSFLRRVGPVWVNGSAAWTKLYNYGRFEYGDYNPNIATFTPYDKVNIQLQLGLRYQF